MEKWREIWDKAKIPTPTFFIVAILLIVYFLPREGKYTYSYTENKPWRYGLLTAPFDFHIQKNENQIKLEKDSVLKSAQSYYKEDAEIAKKSVTQFVQDARAKSVPDIYISYVSRKLNELYKAGVISSEEYEKIQSKDKKQLGLRNENNVVITRHLSSFYTRTQAYEKIINDAPSFIEPTELKTMNINEYLQINILYDENTSTNEKDELLLKVATYEGMVQSGEKIIDRGEIIDKRTFNILNSFTNEMENRIGSKTKPGWLVAGQFVMISLLIITLMTFFLFFRKREYNNRKHIIFILLQVVAACIVTGLVVDYKSDNLLFAIPFAIPIILIRTFIDSRTAMTTHIITTLICAMMIPQSLAAEFIVVQLLVGFVCILSLSNLSERSQLIYTAILILVTYITVYSAWILCSEGDLSQINTRLYIYFSINFIFVTFAYLLVYICERTFGFISEVSMIELSNINRPLLQRLSEVAPGTFQHSMQVSNLVTAAAIKIGANGALVRTGALYHDIGKMSAPAFFTENQTPGMNPHADLNYKESAKIIIGHVEEGVRIAKKHNLPQQIIDFIETHHGKGKAKFFYNSYKNEHPDEEVDEADFTYPGPNPFSKETVLLMMADTVEAASRSLTEYSEKSISELIERLIDAQVKDGLFKNAPITFKDIEMAKEVFQEKLVTIYHSRIAYPELKTKESEKPTQ